MIDGNLISLGELLAMFGSAAGVAAVISFVLERIEWFHKIGSRLKFWIVTVLSFGLPIIALGTQLYVPPEWIAKAEPFWQYVVLGFTVWVSMALVHKVDPERAKRAG